jgi:predicted DCC family thiol-disulfide oxidoreductase YuxK
MTSPAFPTFLYDGDCAFCSSCARFVQRWIPTPAAVEAWQLVDIEALGLTVEACDAAVQWAASPTHHTSGPEAIADLLKSSRPWWRVAGLVLGLRPVLWAAWPAYRWVSRNRDKMPGGTATCALPQAERNKTA